MSAMVGDSDIDPLVVQIAIMHQTAAEKLAAVAREHVASLIAAVAAGARLPVGYMIEDGRILAQPASKAA